MKLRFTIRHLLAFTLLVAILVGVGLRFFPRERLVDPFPPLADIASMDLRSYRSGFKIISAPKSTWKQILDAMRPAKFDAEPANWAMIGDLQLTLNSGGTQTVSLFHGEPGSGAFAIEVFPRKYYRGGDTTKLLAALAMAESQGTPKTVPEVKRNPPDPDFPTVPADE
jgi:hypothetical protein